MERITEQNFHTQVFQLLRSNRFHGTIGAARHKYRRLNHAMAQRKLS